MKKKVSGFMELKTLQDLRHLHRDNTQAPLVKLISARHWNHLKEHHIVSEIYEKGATIHSEETIEKTMKEKQLSREEVLEMATWTQRDGFVVLLTDTYVYFVRLPNNEIKKLKDIPSVKEVSWSY